MSSAKGLFLVADVNLSFLERDLVQEALPDVLHRARARDLGRGRRGHHEPRKVLSEFGVTLPEETEIRVWDSTAETRYMVVPMRPVGTEGWSEEQLAALVTRDSMVGTGLALTPEVVA